MSQQRIHTLGVAAGGTGAVQAEGAFAKTDCECMVFAHEGREAVRCAEENLGSESQKLVSGGGCACEEHGSMGKWACDSLLPPTTALQDPRGVRRGRISPWRDNDARYSFGVQWEPHSSFRTGGLAPH